MHKPLFAKKFFDTIRTVQIADYFELVAKSLVKSLFTSIPLEQALDCTETVINLKT